MQSKWSDADARKFVSDYTGKGINEDLALRTYTTRQVLVDALAGIIADEFPRVGVGPFGLH